MANLSNINGKFVVEQTTGYVGIGDTDPDYLLHLASADVANGTRLAIENTNGSGKVYGLTADNTGVFSLRDLTASTDRLTISSGGDATFSGKVTSDALELDYNTSYYNQDKTISAYSASNYVYVNGIGGASGQGLRLMSEGAATNQIGLENSNNSIFFNTNSTLALTLDSSQNATFAGGIEVNQYIRNTTSNTNSNYIQRDSANTALYVQQRGAGNIVQFQYGAGAIGSATDALTISGTGNATFAGMITVNGGGIDIDNNDDVRLRFDNASTFMAGLQVATTAGDMISSTAINDFAVRSQANLIFSSGGNTERMRIDQTHGDKTFISSYSGGTFPLRVGHGTYASFTPTFVINDSGNVGIGNTTAYSRLEVTAPTTKTNLGTVSNQTITCSGGGGVGEYNQIGFGYTAGDWSPAVIGYVTTNGAVSTLGALIFATRNSTTAIAPTERMRIDNVGNVGIAGTPPADQYTASGGGWKCLQIGNTNQVAAYGTAEEIGIFQNTYLSNPSGLWVGHTASVMASAILLGGPSGTINFYNSTTAADKSQVRTSRMKIDTNGNVGIGITAPAAILAIGSGVAKTSTGTEEVLYLGQSNEASNYSVLQVYTKGGAAQADRSVSFQTIETGVANAGSIVLQPSGGNVGIATTSPGATLDVNGATYVRNVIYGYAGAGNQYGGLSWGGTDEGFLFLKDSNVTKVNINSNGDSYLNGGNVGIGTTTFAPTVLKQLKIGDMGSGAVGEIYDANVAAGASRLILATASGTGVIPIISGRHYSAAYGYDIWVGYVSPWDVYFDARGTDQGFVWRNYTNNNGGEVTLMRLSGQTEALEVKGDIIAYGSPSDKRLKENIKPIESALDKVSKLQGVTFDWKKSDSVLDIKKDIGFIAQDVQKVIPELVRENDNGLLSLRHQGITPILLEAIKELKAEIEELKSKPCNCNNCNCK